MNPSEIPPVWFLRPPWYGSIVAVVLLSGMIWFYVWQDVAPPDAALGLDVSPWPKPPDGEDASRIRQIWDEVTEAAKGGSSRVQVSPFLAAFDPFAKAAVAEGILPWTEDELDEVFRHLFEAINVTRIELKRVVERPNPRLQSVLLSFLGESLFLCQALQRQASTPVDLRRAVICELRLIEKFRALPSLQPSPQALRDLIFRLRVADETDDLLARHVRINMRAHLASLQEGNLSSLMTWLDHPSTAGTGSSPPSFSDKLTYKPNMTQVAMLEVWSQFNESLERGDQEIWEVLQSRMSRSASALRRGTWTSKLHPNHTGLSIAQLMIDQTGYRAEEIRGLLILRRCLILNLALRLHEVERGTLQASLEALIPAYLDKLPEVPWTGLPMSWDVKTGSYLQTIKGEWIPYSLPYPWYEGSGGSSEAKR